jgi:hypothetical protein
MSFKKMRQKKSLTKIIGICDCGFEKEFDPFNELDRSDYHRFLFPFICPKCGEKYFSLDKNEKSIKSRTFKLNFWVTGVLIGFIFLICALGFIGFNKDESDPTFLETGNPNNMTKKELEQYLEWKDKQKDDEKIFDKE